MIKKDKENIFVKILSEKKLENNIFQKILNEQQNTKKDNKIVIKKNNPTIIDNKNKGFDDELFENMNTIDILMTDPSHIPIAKEPEKLKFYRNIVENLKNVEYNPTIEKSKYDYENIKKTRKKNMTKEKQENR